MRGSQHRAKNKTVILLYNNCVLFAVAKTSMEMAKGSEVITVSLDTHRPIKTLEGFIVTALTRLDDIPVDEIGCLIITGGCPDELYDHPRWSMLEQVLNRLNEDGKLICGICGGVFPIVASGLLDGKSFTGDLDDYKNYPELLKKAEYIDAAVVINGNIITAKDNAEIEFAVKIAELAGFYKSKESMERSLAHYKNLDAKIVVSS